MEPLIPSAQMDISRIPDLSSVKSAQEVSTVKMVPV